MCTLGLWCDLCTRWAKVVLIAAAGILLLSSTASAAVVHYFNTIGGENISIGNSDQIFIDNTNSRVGIGTTAPTSTFSGLDISSGGLSLVLGAENGASARTNVTAKTARIGAYHYTNAEEPVGIALASIGATTNIIDFGGGSGIMNAATQIGFWTAANSTTISGTERMRIQSDGNVGIGTTGPLSILQVSKDGSTANYGAATIVNQGIAITGTSGSTNPIGITFGNDINSYGGIYGAFESGVGNTQGHIAIALRKQTSDSTFTEAIRIDNQGNVGIGTTSPAATLHINSSAAAGALRIESTSGSSLLFVNGSSGQVGIGTTGPEQKLDVNGYINVANGLVRTGTVAANAHIRGFNAVVAAVGQNLTLAGNDDSSVATGLTIDSSGFVGVGMYPTVKFHVSSADTAFTRIGLQNTAAGGNFFILMSSADGAAIGGGKFTIYDNSADKHRVVLDTNGNIGIGTTNPSAKLDVSGSANVLALNVNNTFYVNTSTSNIGIGTANPGAKLELASGQLFVPSGSTLLPSITTSSDPDTGLSWEGGPGRLLVTVNGLSKVRFDSTRTTPGTDGDYDLGEPTGKWGNVYSAVGTFGTTPATAGTLRLPNTGDIEWRNAANNANVVGMAFGTDNNLQLMPSSGNVGIGTTGPGARLDVKSSGNSTWAIRAINSATTNTLGGFFQDSDGDGEIYAYNSAGVATINLRADTGNSYINAGNVGIGTTNAPQKLVVSGTVNNTILNVSDGSQTFGVYIGRLSGAANDNGVSLGTNTETPLRIYTNNSDRVTIDTSGNVGIGTTAPGTIQGVAFNSRLDVKDTTQGSGILVEANGFAQLVMSDTAAGAGLKTFQIMTDNGITELRSRNDAGTAKVSFLGLDHNTGNVGIGTTAPNGTLHAVLPTAAADSDNAFVVWDWAGPDTSPFVIKGDGRVGIGTNDPGTAGLAVMNGNVGIGTTGPTGKLEIAGGTDDASAENLDFLELRTSDSALDDGDRWGIRWNQQGADLAGIDARWEADTSSVDIHFDGYLGGVQSDLMVIKGGGSVGIGTTEPKATLHVSPGVIRIGTEIGLFETTAASSVACDTACSNNVTSYGGFNAGSGSCLKAWDDGSAGTLTCDSTSAAAKHCLCTGGY